MTSRDELTLSLTSNDPEERRRAVSRLTNWPSEEVVEPLVRALGDADWRVRKEATASAIKLRSPAVIQCLVAALGPDDDNIGRRNAAVEALAGSGEECVEALRAAVSSLDADGRKLAAEALGRCGQDTALGLLKGMMDDDDPNVRVAVVEAMATVGATSVDVVAPILESFLSNDDSLLKLTALTGLNELGVTVEWTRLHPSLDDPILREAALIAAGRSADPSAAPVLIPLLERARGTTFDTVLAALVDFVRASSDSLLAARKAAANLSRDAHERVCELARSTDSVERRRRALLLLGALNTEAAARVATDALSEDAVTTEAEETLGTLGELAVGPLLDKIAAGPSPQRALCVELVGHLVGPQLMSRAIVVLRGALDDPSDEVIAAVLTVLSALGDASCIEPSAQLLSASGVRSRRAAALAVSGIARRLPEEALKLVRDATPDGPRAHAAILVIGAIDGPALDSEDADVAFLSNALSHDDAQVRRDALNALARVHSEQAVETAAFALTDEVPSVRSAAVRALGRMRTPDRTAAGVAQLLELIEHSQDVELVAEATRALGEAGDPKALKWLRTLIRTGTPMVAVLAVDAAARINDPDRVDTIVEGIWHDDPEVVKAALQRLGDQRAGVRSHIIACLDHQAWDVRRLAADLLGRHQSEGAMSRLRHRLAREQDPLVREAIQRALVEMESAAAGIRRTTSPPLRGSSNR